MDIVHDSNLAELMTIRNVYEIPEYVKSSAVPEKTASASVPAEAFAWEERRLFPTTTKSDTWLSAVYFEKHAAEIEPIDRARIVNRLAEAVDFWGIPETDFVRKAQVEKKASTSAELVYRFLGAEHARVTVASAADIEKISSALVAGREDMPWIMRADVAVQALSTAKRFGWELNESTMTELQKSAGYCLADGQQTAKDLKHREYVYISKGRNDLAEKVAALRRTYDGKRSLLPQDVQKVASVLDSLDRFVELHGSYGPSFVAPESIGNSIPICTLRACNEDMIKLADGSRVSRKVVMDNSLTLRHALHKAAGKQLQDVDLVDALQSLPADVSHMALKTVNL